jgi:hypothetical protein
MHLAAILAVLAVGSSARLTSEPLGAVAWLEGCWRDASSARTIDETWSAARDGVMRGTGRTTRDGQIVESESVVLRPDGNALAYEAHPSGQPSAVFLSSAVAAGSVVFENPSHDFPQRIGYEAQGGDALLAWIEGPVNGQVKRVEFHYRRVACQQ